MDKDPERSENTMSDGEEESEPEEEMTEDDRRFLDDDEMGSDVSMYRQMENDKSFVTEPESVKPPSPSPSHTS